MQNPEILGGRNIQELSPLMKLIFCNRFSIPLVSGKEKKSALNTVGLSVPTSSNIYLLQTVDFRTFFSVVQDNNRQLLKTSILQPHSILCLRRGNVFSMRFTAYVASLRHTIRSRTKLNLAAS